MDAQLRKKKDANKTHDLNRFGRVIRCRTSARMKNVMQEHLNLFETETFRNGVPRLHSGAGFADDFRYEQVGKNFAAAGVGEFGIDCDGGVGRVEDYGFGISSGVGAGSHSRRCEGGGAFCVLFEYFDFARAEAWAS
jgi:hypothetical protein